MNTKQLAAAFLLQPLAALLVASLPCGAAAADAGLLGCWQSVRIAQYLADGRSKFDESGACELEFLEDRIVSRCDRPSGRARTEYTYRVVRPEIGRAHV
jgi:hypothetical protein